MFAFYNSLKGFVILFMTFVGIVFTGCQRNELLTLTFDYAAFSAGGDYVEKASPEKLAMIMLTSSIELSKQENNQEATIFLTSLLVQLKQANAEEKKVIVEQFKQASDEEKRTIKDVVEEYKKKARKEAKKDKEWAKNALEENKKNVPQELYRDALLEYKQADLKTASMVGPFQIKISETKDVPISGDWESVRIDGGLVDLSGIINKVESHDGVYMYHFDHDEYKLVLLIPQNFKKFPIAVVFDKITLASVLYGQNSNYLATGAAFIEQIANKVGVEWK